MKGRVIKVDVLCRVEGEGALLIKISEDGKVEAKFRIYEPPRFFEAFLRGRSYAEVPDITARICGICPVAYQMSSVHAIEKAFGVKVDGQLRELRRLLYCGEWIESHVLHAFFLHLPDFLGLDDAFAVARDHRQVVEEVLRVKKAGNDIVRILGGREIHPINVKVGGFYRAPSKAELRSLVDDLKWARDSAVKVIPLLAGLPYPDFESDYEFVALRHPTEYPFSEGRLVSNKGLDISIDEYEQHFAEEHVAHSTALHGVHIGKGMYFVGPLARYNLNADLLTKTAREAAKTAGLKPGCCNPFKSILARQVETIYACEEAIRIIEQYEPPERSYVDVTPRESMGCGCTEAPRGILYHRYRFDSAGLVTDAKITPPTAQNQPTIEDDLRRYVTPRIDMPLDELTWQCEQAIRNYDPCVSCSTHFLKVRIERTH